MYNITSGELEVLLSNLASGNSVDADGVLIVPLGGPAIVGSSPHPATTTVAALGTADAVVTPSGPVVSAPGRVATAPTVSLEGAAPAAAAVHVVENQDAAASQSQPAGSQVDAALFELDAAFGSSRSKKAGS